MAASCKAAADFPEPAGPSIVTITWPFLSRYRIGYFCNNNLGNLGKFFWKTYLGADKVIAAERETQLSGSFGRIADGCGVHGDDSFPDECAIFSPPVGEAPSQAFAYFCFCTAVEGELGGKWAFFVREIYGFGPFLGRFGGILGCIGAFLGIVTAQFSRRGGRGKVTRVCRNLMRALRAIGD